MVPRVFVYGTLKRGQPRAAQWPQSPLAIFAARIRGCLYDLGQYPALVDGDDWIVGECWVMQPEHIGRTLEVLDAIEGFGRGSDDLYVRRIVTCWPETSQLESGPAQENRPVRCHAYFFARPKDLITGRLPATRIRAGAEGYCQWNASSR